jgi:hypothetical protein
MKYSQKEGFIVFYEKQKPKEEHTAMGNIFRWKYNFRKVR